MFGLRKKKIEAENKEMAALVAQAPGVLRALGNLMESYPYEIVDTALLPLPRARLKFVLITAWMQDDSPITRRAIEAAFIHLSMFHDGIGRVPLGMPPSPDFSKESAAVREALTPDLLRKMDKYVSLLKASQVEGEKLSNEFAIFKAKAAH